LAFADEDLGGQGIDDLLRTTFNVDVETGAGDEDSGHTIGSRLCYGWNKLLI